MEDEIGYGVSGAAFRHFLFFLLLSGNTRMNPRGPQLAGDDDDDNKSNVYCF